MKKSRRILVFGHRGSPDRAVENTIPSFLAAVEDGADGVEMDVQLSADERVVVFHDEDLSRLAGDPAQVRTLTLAELQSRELHVGSLPPGRIPALEEVLDALPPEIIVNVELKGFPPAPDGLEAAVVGILARRGRIEQVIISSFNPVRLRTTRRIEPRLKTAFIHAGSLSASPNRTLFRLAGPVDGLHPHFRLVDESYLAAAWERGRFVNTWTVNEEVDMRRMIDLGVDGIFSDRPAVLRRVVGRLPAGKAPVRRE